MSQASLGDKYNEALKVETNKVKAFARALFNKSKGTQELKQVNRIPETLDEVQELNLTPKVNSVRSFILMWLERQERMKRSLS